MPVSMKECCDNLRHRNLRLVGPIRNCSISHVRGSQIIKRRTGNALVYYRRSHNGWMAAIFRSQEWTDGRARWAELQDGRRMEYG